MITRIEIDGYKSFEQFELELRPFTAIAGPNAVGKSNLFDALRHISSLVGKTLRESFETERGSLSDLFTIYPDGSSKSTISYAVELLLPSYIEDQFSTRADLKYRRLRYELKVAKSGEGDLSLLHEKLFLLRRKEDPFLRAYPEVREQLPLLKQGRNTPFIDTLRQQVTISQDGNAGNKRTISLAGAQRTVLSSITTVEFPHAYAAKRMLEDIHFLQFNPEKLRAPSKLAASPYLRPDGENLAAVIARLTKHQPDVLLMLSNDLAAIVPGVGEVILQRDDKREEYIIAIKHTDGYCLPSKLLSDGTLRILALVVISYDPKFDGTIILEEPENGVYPGRIPEIVTLLRSIASLSAELPGLRQMVINTHSVRFIDEMKVQEARELIFAMLKKIASKQHGSYMMTEMGYVEDELVAGRNLVAREQLKRLLSEKALVGAL